MDNCLLELPDPNSDSSESQSDTISEQLTPQEQAKAAEETKRRRPKKKYCKKSKQENIKDGIQALKQVKYEKKRIRTIFDE